MAKDVEMSDSDIQHIAIGYYSKMLRDIATKVELGHLFEANTIEDADGITLHIHLLREVLDVTT